MLQPAVNNQLFLTSATPSVQQFMTAGKTQQEYLYALHSSMYFSRLHTDVKIGTSHLNDNSLIISKAILISQISI